LPFQTDKRRLKQALEPFLAVKTEEEIKTKCRGNIAGTNNNVFEAVRFTCVTAWKSELSQKYACSAFPTGIL
jgi:hypothetical protein